MLGVGRRRGLVRREGETGERGTRSHRGEFKERVASRAQQHRCSCGFGHMEVTDEPIKSRSVEA